jgi:hypothetical protein
MLFASGITCTANDKRCLYQTMPRYHSLCMISVHIDRDVTQSNTNTLMAHSLCMISVHIDRDVTQSNTNTLMAYSLCMISVHIDRDVTQSNTNTLMACNRT